MNGVGLGFLVDTLMNKVGVLRVEKQVKYSGL